MSTGRTFHTDSRTWSNFQPDELVKLCGVHQGRWPVYVVKELLDNSAAALEEHGITNGWIRVEVGQDYVRVSDSGPGISDGALDRILDFDSFGGSNRHVHLPTRGAQGNALMTIVGVATAWSNDSIEVCRPGKLPAVALDVRLDPVQQSVAIDRPEVGRGRVSSVMVPLPPLPWKKLGSEHHDIVDTAHLFALLNPHIAFTIIDRSGKKRTSRGIGAEVGSRPVLAVNHRCGAAQWFTDEEFSDRLAADIRARPDLSVGDWVEECAFVSGFSTAGSGRPISDYAGKGKAYLESQASRLRAMVMSSSDSRRASDPKFDPLGPDRMSQLLRHRGADQEVGAEYHSVKGTSDAGVPFLCEVCLVQMPERTTIAPAPVLALNRTVLYGSPSFKKLQWREKVRGQWWQSRGELSTLCQAYQVDRGRTASAVLVHAISPSPGYSGYGKQNFDTSWLWEALSTCMERVTLKCRKQRAGEARRTTTRSGPRVTIKEDLFSLLPSVLDVVTEGGDLPVLVRQLYYAVRPVYFGLRPDKSELHYGTFCSYLDDYETDVAKRMVCLRDPRGTMYEPHSGRTLRLGTADVEGFNVKKWEGHTIVFVEKENLASLMRRMRLHKRWDAIIIGSKGFAVESIREVLQKYKQLLGDLVKVVCLHDADPAGYMIGYDLATNLPRFGETVDVQVIDVGLSMREAREESWPDEPFRMARSQWSMVNNMHLGKKRSNDGLMVWDYRMEDYRPIFEQEAWDAFMPRRFRADRWDHISGTPTGRRVELNAIGNGSPRAFCEWVEGHLEAHGCKKVRPPDEVVDETLRSARENAISNQAGALFMRLMGEEVVHEVMREIGIPAYDLDGVLEGRPETHWHYLCTRAAQSGDDIGAAVERVMRRRLPEAFSNGT